jgi:hypothetical protein
LTTATVELSGALIVEQSRLALEDAMTLFYISKLAREVFVFRGRCLKSEGSRKSWDMNSHRASAGVRGVLRRESNV